MTNPKQPKFELDAQGRRSRVVEVGGGHQHMEPSHYRLSRTAVGTLVYDLNSPRESTFISDQLLNHLVAFQKDAHR